MDSVLTSKGGNRHWDVEPLTELDEEPETQDKQGREADEFYENENKHQSKNPGVGKEQQIGPQDPGHSPAGANHGNGGGGVGQNLGQSGKEAANQVKKEEAQMAQRIFDVVPEDPQVEHVSEEVEESAMEEHGRQQGEGEWHRREFMENFSMNDLIRDCPPSKDEILAFHNIQGNLVEKHPTIGQD